MIRAGSRGMLTGFGSVAAETIVTTSTITAGGQFLAPAGTAAAPGYAFAGAPAVGLYSSSATAAYLASSSAATIGTSAGAGIVSAVPFDTFGRMSEQGIWSSGNLLANTDNWAVNTAATVLRVSSDAAYNITGIVAPASSAPRTHRLVNVGAFSLTLKHDVTSTAANRFYGPGAADFVLTQYMTVTLRYDTTLTRWLIEA